MTTEEFICNCLGLYKPTIAKIDEIVESFDLDFDEVLTDTIIVETAQKCGKNMGNELIRICFDKIIDQACEQHGDSIRDKFDMYLNDFCSGLIFNEEEVFSLEDLEDEILKVK